MTPDSEMKPRLEAASEIARRLIGDAVYVNGTPVTTDVYGAMKSIALNAAARGFKSGAQSVQASLEGEIAALREALAVERLAGIRAGLEAAAKLVQAGDFAAGNWVRLDPKRHANLSDWFNEQQAAAIRAIDPSSITPDNA